MASGEVRLSNQGLGCPRFTIQSNHGFRLLLGRHQVEIRYELLLILISVALVDHLHVVRVVDRHAGRVILHTFHIFALEYFLNDTAKCFARLPFAGFYFLGVDVDMVLDQLKKSLVRVRLLIAVAVEHLHVFLGVAHILLQEGVEALKFLLDAGIVIFIAGDESVSLRINPSVNRFLLGL